jgi:HSP20 family protein
VRDRTLLQSGEQKEGKELAAFAQPAADIVDKGDEFNVMVDLPGIDKKDLSVVVREKAIEIRAERKTERKEEKEGYYFQERGYQGYARTLPLPEEVLPSETKAEYNNGVLELTIKKAHPKESKDFKVSFD